MAENNFEKTVQEQMQGFKIKPSEEVWQKVEERIRKKKNRRIFFILLFAGIGLLGYWQRDFLFNEKESLRSDSGTVMEDKVLPPDSFKTISPAETNKHILVNETREESEPAVVDKEKATHLEKKKTVTAIVKDKKSGTADKPVNFTKPQDTKPAFTQIRSEKDELKKNPVSSDSSHLTFVKEEKVVQRTPFGEIGKNISANKADTVVVSVVDPVVENKVMNDSIQKNEKVAEAIIEAMPLADLITEKEIQMDSLAGTKKSQRKTNKWKWGVQFTPGVSIMTNHFFSFSLNKSADVSYLNSPNTPTGSIGIPPPRPSDRTTGLALQAGGFIQRKIANKLELSLGLQYSYYSDHIFVGNRRDSILNYSPQIMSLRDASQVYAVSSSFKNFTNRYHFIELPVALHFQLNKNSNKPVYLNLGFTTGQMIASRALVFDTAFGGIYYDNKKLFNKTQFSLNTGLLWTIPAKKMQWNFGPVINVHLNKLFSNPFEADKYILMVGFRTRIILSGKK